ncbi:MAG: Hsp20/alpha crystallin family protein [Bacteroidetes bacterium]|nr:Hsp20/alpha crystallin family protein [Bacteroidota bacterium]MBI3481859.1 Hsp20/alpha crystallin family protein [Bacteroidota bacterium]
MTLVKKSDWPSMINNSLLSDFFDGDRFFDSDWLRKQSVPAVNVKENETNFEIEVAAPGLSKKDFRVTAENRMLSISSEKQEEKEEKEKDYTRREFSYSSFNRSFTLPENVNEDDIKANYEDGILKLRIAKKVIGQPKAKKAIDVR